MKVLAIPEDQELDRYIIKPVLEAMFEDLGMRARVDVLPEPRLRGLDDALDAELLREIVTSNPMEDLFVLVVDRDCDRAGVTTRVAARVAEHADRMLPCIAVEELEVWLLALYKAELDDGFATILTECDPKERWAEPLLRRLGTDGPGRGRKRAMQALRGKYRSVRDTCTELRDLEGAIRTWAARR